MQTRARSSVRVECPAPPARIPFKRRSSVVTAEQDNKTQSGNVERASPADCIIVASTPRTKRVRFSDPGFDIGPSNSDTGLTPALRRTTLFPSKSHAFSPSKARRRSAPCPQTPSDVEELHFLPLKQVLDTRLRRRLRRSHLSEEVNDIEAAQREDEISRRELAVLRSKSTANEDRIAELLFELESQRQLGIEVYDEEDARVQALRGELDTLRKDAMELPPPIQPDSPTEVASDDGWWISSDTSALRESSPPSSPPPQQSDMAVQADLEHPASLAELKVLKLDSQRLNRELSDSRAALSAIHADLNTLGYSNASASTDTILHDLHHSFRTARLELEHLLPGETVDGLESPRMLLPSLLTHVRMLLGRLHAAQRTASTHAQSESSLRTQFNLSLSRIADLENRGTVLLAEQTVLRGAMADKDEQLTDLENAGRARIVMLDERDAERDRLRAEAVMQREDGQKAELSITRLQGALGKYRGEVVELEKLVGRMEDERAGWQRRFTQDHDVLERKLDETRGRFAAFIALTRENSEGQQRASEEAERWLES